MAIAYWLNSGFWAGEKNQKKYAHDQPSGAVHAA